MKAIPPITILLIAQTMYLNHVIDELARVHFTVYASLPVIDRQLLNTNMRWLGIAGFIWFGFALLSLALIVVSWRNHLCRRWILVGIVLLWLIMFFNRLHPLGTELY